jgi:PIN domain nuclease of toxin-antitoxin system
MRLLLDTEIMLWWLLDDPRLRPDTRKLMTSTPCVVSVASIWEVAIKHRLGKLPVAPALFRDQSMAAGASILPVLEGHVIETAELPPVHGDPFDRLLIAQARVEALMAVSADAHWCGYDVKLHRV